MTLFKKFIIFLSLCFFLFLCWHSGVSRATLNSSDQISLSGPGVPANHNIRTGIVDTIQPQGRIDVVFDGNFVFPPDFDYTDIDLAVSNSYDGFYIDRSLSNVLSATDDSVSISTGTTESVISINLNSSEGIPAGRYISIELGSNALSGAFGTSTQIINPSAVGPYRINVKTYDNNNDYLEEAEVSVFIIEPVGLKSYVTKKRSGAAPVGWLGYGTSQTILSLYTNFKAICRYSTASGTPFSMMTDEFSYVSSSTDSFYHTKLVTGLSSGGQYNFFVRCIDDHGVFDDSTECMYSFASTTPFHTASGTPLLNVDCVDYPIPFRISSIAGSTGDTSGNPGNKNTGETKAGSGSSGGGSGGGKGPERGSERTGGKYLPYPPPPGSPGVALKGWSYPSVDVHINKDGVEEGYTTTNAAAQFAAFLEILNRGVYTFGLWSSDSSSRKSAPYTTTFWMEAGTQTEIVNIIIPPTIELQVSQIQNGGSFGLLGQSVPNSTVEVSLYPKKSVVAASEVIKKEFKSDAIGRWTAQIDTTGLNSGLYQMKARTNVASAGYSSFSSIVEGSIGVTVEKPTTGGVCAGADLNHDGKVNLTDFSILLYNWGGNDACADQNQDGKVDLIDFSIMMYNWTG